MKYVLSGFLIAFAVVALTAAQDRTGDRHTRWSTTENGRQLRVETVGTIELTDDERDIKTVSPDGFFELSSKGWLSLFGQRYIVRGNADGTVTRVLMSAATEHPIDEAARAWIGNTLQNMVRQGFLAEARARRILTEQGPAGVLDAAADISSDFAQAKYFSVLATQSPIDRPNAERALRMAADDIGSDFELARVLIAFLDVITIDDAISPVFVEATRSIGSDFEHSRVLQALIAKQPHTTAVVNAVVTSSTTIGSDFEKSRVFRDLAGGMRLDASSLVGLIRASGSIGSDFEHSRVLRQIASSQPLDEASRREIVDSARHIGSDYERTRVLASLVQGSTLR